MPRWLRWIGCYYFWGMLSMEFPALFKWAGWPTILGS